MIQKMIEIVKVALFDLAMWFMVQAIVREMHTLEERLVALRATLFFHNERRPYVN